MVVASALMVALWGPVNVSSESKVTILKVLIPKREGGAEAAYLGAEENPGAPTFICPLGAKGSRQSVKPKGPGLGHPIALN